MNYLSRLLYTVSISLMTLLSLGFNADSAKVEQLGRESLSLVYSHPDSAKSKISEGFAIC